MVRLSSKISGLSHLDIKKPLPQCSDIHSDIKCDPYNNASNAHTLIKKFLIYKKFRREQWQSYIWLKASSYMTKYLRIFSYIRKPFLICDFATAPIWISLYMRKIIFSFLSVQWYTYCGTNSATTSVKGRLTVERRTTGPFVSFSFGVPLYFWHRCRYIFIFADQVHKFRLTPYCLTAGCMGK
jgi:hypothetical protein